MNKSSICNTLILLPIYWLFSGMLLMSGGDKPMVAMVIISIIATLSCYGLSSAKTNIKQDKFLWAILAMTAFAIFSYHYHGYSSRGLRALLCGSLFLIFLPRQLLSLKLIYILLFIGSLCSMFMPFYYGEYLNVERGVWPINAIPQATLSSAIGLAALASAIEAKHLERYLMLIAFTFSSIAVIFSQSRGLWLGHFIVSGLIFFIKYRHCLLNRKSSMISLALLVASSIILAPVVESRLDQTRDEIQKIERGNFDTSIGLRLEMWMLSPKLLTDHFVLGLGSTHQEKFDELRQQNLVSDSLNSFRPTHYHNQYIDQLVRNGLIGLVLLCFLLAVPMSSLPTQFPVIRYTVGAIVMLYAIAGLTDVPFNHAQSILLYTVLISCLKTLKQNENHD